MAALSLVLIVMPETLPNGTATDKPQARLPPASGSAIERLTLRCVVPSAAPPLGARIPPHSRRFSMVAETTGASSPHLHPA